MFPRQSSSKSDSITRIEEEHQQQHPVFQSPQAQEERMSSSLLFSSAAPMEDTSMLNFNNTSEVSSHLDSDHLLPLTAYSSSSRISNDEIPPFPFSSPSALPPLPPLDARFLLSPGGLYESGATSIFQREWERKSELGLHSTAELGATPRDDKFTQQPSSLFQSVFSSPLISHSSPVSGSTSSSSFSSSSFQTYSSLPHFPSSMAIPSQFPAESALTTAFHPRWRAATNRFNNWIQRQAAFQDQSTLFALSIFLPQLHPSLAIQTDFNIEEYISLICQIYHLVFSSKIDLAFGAFSADAVIIAGMLIVPWTRSYQGYEGLIKFVSIAPVLFTIQHWKLVKIQLVNLDQDTVELVAMAEVSQVIHSNDGFDIKDDGIAMDSWTFDRKTKKVSQYCASSNIERILLKVIPGLSEQINNEEKVGEALGIIERTWQQIEERVRMELSKDSGSSTSSPTPKLPFPPIMLPHNVRSTSSPASISNSPPLTYMQSSPLADPDEGIVIPSTSAPSSAHPFSSSQPSAQPVQMRCKLSILRVDCGEYVFVYEKKKERRHRGSAYLCYKCRTAICKTFGERTYGYNNFPVSGDRAVLVHLVTADLIKMQGNSFSYQLNEEKVIQFPIISVTTRKMRKNRAPKGGTSHSAPSSSSSATSSPTSSPTSAGASAGASVATSSTTSTSFLRGQKRSSSTRLTADQYLNRDIVRLDQQGTKVNRERTIIIPTTTAAGTDITSSNITTLHSIRCKRLTLNILDSIHESYLYIFSSAEEGIKVAKYWNKEIKPNNWNVLLFKLSGDVSLSYKNDATEIDIADYDQLNTLLLQPPVDTTTTSTVGKTPRASRASEALRVMPFPF